MKPRAPANRTLLLTAEEAKSYRTTLITPSDIDGDGSVRNRIIHGKMEEALERVPEKSVDLLILDPPYNLSKEFHGVQFRKRSHDAYTAYLESWFLLVLRVLKDSGSVYLCGEWRSSAPLQKIMEKHLILRNRITWQREKGRGAKANWKNSSEDIWFGTVGQEYYFDVDAVKIKRRVLAPYRSSGKARDWVAEEGGKYRLTYPGNNWDDITVPYWSMPENTDHPTQKPEKLFARLILASCPPQGIVLDPFLGSGTSAVVAKKLGRSYVGIEQNETYCLWAAKRLALADANPSIQGYEEGVFWERNSRPARRSGNNSPS